MTHSYRVHFYHCIWATKQRRAFIIPKVQIRLYTYINGIITNHSGTLLEIGGMPDHVHLLLKLGDLQPYSHFVRDVKACSSAWIHKNFPDMQDFAWQEGYGSFSVSYSVLNSVQKYIQNQEKHHKNMTFEQEYLRLLQLHNTPYDDRFVFG